MHYSLCNHLSVSWLSWTALEVRARGVITYHRKLRVSWLMHALITLKPCSTTVRIFTFHQHPDWKHVSRQSMEIWLKFVLPVSNGPNGWCIHLSCTYVPSKGFPDSKVHGANMWPIRGRQDPGGARVGHMNLAILVVSTIRLQLHGSRLNLCQHQSSRQLYRNITILMTCSNYFPSNLSNVSNHTHPL